MRYVSVFCGMLSSGIAAGDPTFHVFTTGRSSASRSPRNVIALTSSSGFAVDVVGTNPAPENLNAMSSSSWSGMGRNSPTSVLLTAFTIRASRSYRKMFETPVWSELP